MESVPDLIGPVVGIRAWKLGVGRNAADWRLRSVGVSYVWPPWQLKNREGAKHIAGGAAYENVHDGEGCPDPHDACGYWIVKEPLWLYQRVLEGRSDWFVLGGVKGWGRTFEHEGGWRCEYAAPLCLYTFKESNEELRRRMEAISRSYRIPIEVIDRRTIDWAQRNRVLP